MNRYPMLFIDRVTEWIPGKSASGYKLFSYNEWFFHGYETAEPKVWNAIQIEAMSQMFLMTFLTKEELQGSVAMSNKFDNVQFYRKIVPGERLDIVANLERFGRGVAKGKVTGSVNGEPACSMECTIIVPMLFGDVLQSKSEDKNAEVIDESEDSSIQFGIKQIKDCLLNKYPWLYIDYVKAIEPGKSVVAVKNFTFNEFYFPEHFPGDPSVPGFIQIEACMQAFLLTFLSLEDYKRSETADRSLNNIFVRRKIVPGESLVIKAELISFRRGIAKGKVESFIGNEPAMSFETVVAIPSELEKFKPRMK